MTARPVVDANRGAPAQRGRVTNHGFLPVCIALSGHSRRPEADEQLAFVDQIQPVQLGRELAATGTLQTSRRWE